MRAAMDVTPEWLAAEAERLRDQNEADRLAAELGCEVMPDPHFAGRFEARDPAPGVWLLSGLPDEIRAEWRKAWLREWVTSYLGTLKRDRRGPLTKRELEIGRLAAKGLRSREIAAQLFLSRRTVEAHLRNIYAKTGTGGPMGARVRLAVWVQRHDAEAALAKTAGAET